MEVMRAWKNMGMVETIYEEEHEDSSSCLSISSLPTPLHSRVEAWSLDTGRETDVIIHVQGSCFHLHKDPLASRSGYLKRQLMELSEITVSPPLNIKPETFGLVAYFCYGTHLVITPFNVAALRTAAELLEMTETNGTDDENLKQKTEKYFCRAVAVNREYASIVLRSCLLLLPEAETTAFLVSRCIEALSLMDDVNGVISCLEDVKTVSPEDFQLIAESMHQQLTGSHDLLYRVVDHYLKEHNGKITDEHKTLICNFIDCTNLSPQILMHAVQNPRMPLRFIVQAMFIEQLNTRRSVIFAADRHARHHQTKDTTTLGTILQRDATLRESAQLKAAMDTTSSRIQCLEKQLNGMRKFLTDSENGRSVLDSGRSESSRFDSERKVERGQRGSVSSVGFRVVARKEMVGGSSSSEESFNESPRVEKNNFGRRLMNGLKSALRVSTSASKKITES